ncbi:MAG: sensor histidine kinase [Terracidiphilus sp.]
MPDYYHAPALILIALLLPAFGYLYYRFRDTRTLLWFLGFLFALVSMVLLYQFWHWNRTGPGNNWTTAAGEAAAQAGAAVFLGSLSPLRFRMGRFRILYVIPYSLPIVAAAILQYGFLRDTPSHGTMQAVFIVLAAVSFAAALLWSAAKDSVPHWIGISLCAAMGAWIFWIWHARGIGTALACVERANLLVTALLVVLVFRRFSPGVMLSTLGLAAWSLTAVRTAFSFELSPELGPGLVHVIAMGKVVAAMGVILLALEDELDAKKGSEERERRARRELEAYANLVLSRRQVDDFDRQANEICRTITEFSRFAQAVLLFESGRRYRVAGAAGLDPATTRALDDLAARIPIVGFLATGSAPLAVENCRTFRLDLTPWLRPGDDLKRLRFTSALAVPVAGRSGTVEGALLLSGMRPAGGVAGAAGYTLRADDLLPIELLAARLQASRSQTILFEKLFDSEKFAGLGQLAASVTQQLNNPLTVILGYASLLEDSTALDARERKGVESILSEARRMKAAVESLSRIARPYSADYAAVALSELMADIEELHRADFLRRSIEFRVSIAPGLPRVLCSAQQLRQAMLHGLQYAAEAVESQDAADSAGQPRSVRLEASSESGMVQILIAHSGPAFLNPERAFDPFTPSQPDAETAALGLSLCATVMRDNNGRASAVNLGPRGAAILLELRAA